MPFHGTCQAILLGHDDTCKADKAMRVTLMLNVFGDNLTQRMPRCQNGRFHIVNNYYPKGWAMYAIGGSANPIILREANFFVASGNVTEVRGAMVHAQMECKTAVCALRCTNRKQ